MSVAESDSPGRDPNTRRWPCPWCSAQEAWPDGCLESIDAAIDAEDDDLSAQCCISMIEKQCMLGDHRRCQVGACTVATRWHEPVREAGIAAAKEAGKVWAIVSTINNLVEVIGTSDQLNQAKITLRAAATEAGYLGDPEGKGLVYIVRRSDGGFL